MEKVGIILLVLFVCIILLGPITCVKLSRDERAKVYNPQPCQLDDARRKLSTYTTRSMVASRAKNDSSVDLEAALASSELGECPICIGPLVPEPVHTAGSDPLSALQQVTSVASKRPEIEEVHANHPGSQSKKTDVNTSVDAADDDILSLNSCGHTFHSKCLSSWFLIERFDCPLCRVPYYNSKPRRERTFSVPPFF